MTGNVIIGYEIPDKQVVFANSKHRYAPCLEYSNYLLSDGEEQSLIPSLNFMYAYKVGYSTEN